jgi:hypothetical protein
LAKRQSDADILATARARFKLAEEAEREIRVEAATDLRFAAGDQWETDDRNRREYAGLEGGGKRPCLTFNKLTGPINQTANEARMNQSGIQVNPVDMESDPDTADVIEGMIRHIEYVSKADEIYETAVEQSTAGSFGYFKVVTEYCCPESFEQELRIERIADPFTVYIDPFARKADKSDMQWAFELELMPKEEYRQKYGKTSVAANNFFQGMYNPVDRWVSDQGVLIGNYWTVETEKKKLVAIQWPDDRITGVYDDELPRAGGFEMLPPGVTRALDPKTGKPQERETEVRTVKVYQINGHEILDETVWRGQWIPIFPVLGKEMYVDGKRQLFSLIRFARDPQKLYNFYRSSEAEAVMLGTKAPWIGVKGAFRDPRWAKANIIPYAYLEYEPLDIAGQPAPPPQRNIAEPPIQALSLGAAQASDDIKATTNVYDASLGERSNETSGIAIQRRQNQSGLSNFHFIDNLNRAIRQCGVVLCDLIPKIYDTPRQVRVLGEDRKQKIVMVNQKYKDEMEIDRCYKLNAGKYDVTITTGPSYTTQRQETFDVLTQFAQAYPQLLQIAGDLVFQNADFPAGEKIAERFKKALPPGLADPPEGMPQLPPEVAQGMAQQAQQIEQLTALVQKQAEEIRTKQIEAESNERIQLANIMQKDRAAALDATIKEQELALKKRELELKTGQLHEQLTSKENIEAFKAEAAAQAQIARMASGAAAEESTEPAPAGPA